MYARFKLDFEPNADLNKNHKLYVEEAKKVYAEKKRNNLKKIKDSIYDSLSDNNTTILMNNIEKTWFPSHQCHVFLSHSHKDEERALAISGWMKKSVILMFL